jgi:hypothetical protein
MPSIGQDRRENYFLIRSELDLAFDARTIGDGDASQLGPDAVWHHDFCEGVEIPVVTAERDAVSVE